MDNEPNPGLVLVHTGEGKGKTTAALGMALRTLGHGGRVFMAQFLKGRPETGECLAAAKYLPGFTLRQFGRPEFVTTVQDVDRDLAREALAAGKAALHSRRYALVILDEVNVALSLGLIAVSEVLEALDQRPPGVHVVLTGRGAPEELLQVADLVTEMREVKHPFHSGIPAQPGIDF